MWELHYVNEQMQMSKRYDGEDKMATIHNQELWYAWVGCTPVWSLNNSQHCRLDFASKLKTNASAIDSTNCTNMTTEVSITPLHSTKDGIKNGNLYVTDFIYQWAPVHNTKNRSQLHAAPTCTRYKQKQKLNIETQHEQQ